MSEAALPLVGRLGPTDTIFWRDGRRVARDGFLADVNDLAARLPAHGQALNLCEDRYHFIVGLAAALARGHTTLLPQNRSEGLLREVAGEYPDTYLVLDEGPALTGVPAVEIYDGASRTKVDSTMPMIPAEQVAILAFTSGSTGRPKPNPKTWRALVANAGMVRSCFLSRFNSGANIVATVPPQHMYGMETSVLLCLHGGIAVHSGRPFFPEDVHAALDSVPEPRVLVTTPVHLRACVKSGVKFPPLAFLLSATAPLAPALAREAEERFGAPVMEMYGCTETASIASRRAVEGEAWTLYDEVSMTVEGNAATVSGPQIAGTFTMQDIIEAIDARHFVLRGRSSDMVNIAGKRASLADLNHRLHQIDGVQDGVIFLPDADGASDERLAALVVAPSLSRERLLTELRRMMDPVFLPRPLCMVDVLPRTEASKLPRQALLDLLKREAGHP